MTIPSMVPPVRNLKCPNCGEHAMVKRIVQYQSELLEESVPADQYHCHRCGFVDYVF